MSHYSSTLFGFHFLHRHHNTASLLERAIDVALKGVEARHTTTNNATSIIQQPHEQRKVQHTGPTVLTATKNHVQFLLHPLAASQRSVTGSRMRLFDQTNSLVDGETAPASHMSIPCPEKTCSNWSINHPHVRARTLEVHSAQKCVQLLSPNTAHNSSALHIQESHSHEYGKTLLYDVSRWDDRSRVVLCLGGVDQVYFGNLGRVPRLCFLRTR